MVRLFLPAALALTFATSPVAQSQPARFHPPASHKATTQKTQIGLASWYGKQFDGKPTWSGERFDMYALTAAHRSLPIGALVRVTNLCNLKSVILRINDRGPVPRRRMIDVSYAAARLLGFKTAGIVPVRLELLDVHSKRTLTLAKNEMPMPLSGGGR